MRILIRADADAAMGSGHLMRCLALAEALAARRADVRFLCAPLPPSLERRIRNAGFPLHAVAAEPGSIEDAATVRAHLRSRAPSALVLDGYHFDTRWRRMVRADTAALLAFDDLAALPDLAADLVVNASPAAATLPYPRIAPGARLLLGPSWFPMRRELAARLPPDDAPSGRRLLVSFGGSDPLGLSAPFLTALIESLDAAPGIDLVLGGGVRHLDATRHAADRWQTVALHVDSRAMADLMRSAGLAVVGAGGTVLELAAFRVPMVLAATADNQALLAAAAERVGWGAAVDARGTGGLPSLVEATTALWHDAGRRTAMAAAMRGAVDGQGAGRIAEALLAGLGG